MYFLTRFGTYLPRVRQRSWQSMNWYTAKGTASRESPPSVCKRKNNCWKHDLDRSRRQSVARITKLCLRIIHANRAESVIWATRPRPLFGNLLNLKYKFFPALLRHSYTWYTESLFPPRATTPRASLHLERRFITLENQWNPIIGGRPQTLSVTLKVRLSVATHYLASCTGLLVIHGGAI